MASDPVNKKTVERDVERSSEDDAVSFGKGDILQLEHVNPVLNAKMHLVNNVSAWPTGIDFFLGKSLMSVLCLACGMSWSGEWAEGIY